MALKDFKVLQGLGIESSAGAEIRITTYAGNPEGNVTATVGSLCSDTTNGKLYKKTSGTSTSGWDEVVAGSSSSWKEPVTLASTAELIVTASGSKVGKILTADADGKLTLDGIDALQYQRVLIKNQGDSVGDLADNGIYIVTETGDVDNPFVLTRSTDADENDEVKDGLSVLIANGTTLSGQLWFVTSNDPIDLDVDDLVFDTLKVVYTASNGVKITSGNNIEADLDAAGAIELNTNSLRINVDSTNNTTEINSNNELQVSGMKNDSGTFTGSADVVDTIALTSSTDMMHQIVVTNGTSGKYSCIIHSTGFGSTVDYSIYSINKLGTISTPSIDITISAGNIIVTVTSTNGYTYNIKRIAN